MGEMKSSAVKLCHTSLSSRHNSSNHGTQRNNYQFKVIWYYHKVLECQISNSSKLLFFFINTWHSVPNSSTQVYHYVDMLLAN